jgi:lysophospholipase L1-like esterase
VLSNLREREVVMSRSVTGARVGFGAAVLVAWALSACAQPDNPATKPTERKDKGSVARHERFVKTAKAGGVDVLFLGDSITQGWEGAGKDVWAAKYAPLKAANFGIGGDRTEHVLWRITEGKELDGIDPKVVVLMIGTNNAGSNPKGGNTAEQIADGVAAIVAEIRKQKPKTKVLLLGVFPRSGPGVTKDDQVCPPDRLQPKIKAINERLAKLDDGKNVKYLDIGDRFLTNDGGLSREVMPDFLHLSPRGYVIWAEAIEKPLAELLKQ